MRRLVLLLSVTGMLFLAQAAALAEDSAAPAAAINLHAKPVEGRVKLEWCKPKGVEGIVQYEIYKKEQGSLMSDSDMTPANKIGGFGSNGGCLEYSDADVKSGHTYSYAVTAADEGGSRLMIEKNTDIAALTP